jgi:HD-GYP domain-containing protein (c-di-GMP phosphodiesterase class II)
MSKLSTFSQVEASPTVVVQTANLRSGSKLQRPLYDSGGILLLNAGSEITDAIKTRLLERQIEQVVLSREDAAAMLSEAATPSASKTGRRKSRPALPLGDQRHEAVAASISSLVRSAGMPLKNQMMPRGKEPYDRHFAQRLASRFATTTKSVELVMRRVIQGAGGDASVLAEVMGGYIREMEQDLDHVLTSSGNLADVKQLVQRSLRMAMLGMAVGIELGLDGAKVGEIGTCALVHDWGLYCLPERLRRPNEPFSEDDWEMYMRHPSLTLDALERISNLSPVVKLASAQVHEMCDGSGYPRGLAYNRIHIYARILGPVDAFMSLTEARRGRPAIVPHDALACLLHQIPLGRFDGAVIKALLGALSLFPLGSFVRLTDGQDALVIRRSAKDYTRPVVQYLRLDGPHAPSDADPPQTIIDLAESQLEIAEVLLAPGKTEMRLDRSLMYDVVWDGPEA